MIDRLTTHFTLYGSYALLPCWILHVSDPDCMHAQTGPVSHSTYNSYAIKENAWCYEASVKCKHSLKFYNNIV